MSEIKLIKSFKQLKTDSVCRDGHLHAFLLQQAMAQSQFMGTLAIGAKNFKLTRCY